MKSLLLSSGIILGSLSPRVAAEPGAPAALVEHAKAHPTGNTAFSFDQSVWAGETKNLPIGVFDSGIGGLTVLEAVLKLDAFQNDTLQPGPDGKPDFEKERFIYFGDQANMPYGNYPAADQTPYLRELKQGESCLLPDDQFFLSVPDPSCPGVRTGPDGGLERDYKYHRTTGAFAREDIINVPLTARTLPKSSARLVKEKLPLVWQRLESRR